MFLLIPTLLVNLVQDRPHTLNNASDVRFQRRQIERADEQREIVYAGRSSGHTYQVRLGVGTLSKSARSSTHGFGVYPTGNHPVRRLTEFSCFVDGRRVLISKRTWGDIYNVRIQPVYGSGTGNVDVGVERNTGNILVWIGPLETVGYDLQGTDCNVEWRISRRGEVQRKVLRHLANGKRVLLHRIGKTWTESTAIDGLDRFGRFTTGFGPGG